MRCRYSRLNGFNPQSTVCLTPSVTASPKIVPYDGWEHGVLNGSRDSIWALSNKSMVQEGEFSFHLFSPKSH